MPDESIAAPSALVQQLLRELAERDISWCQWKSTIDLDRAASGASDLDLLVARSDQPALLEILGRLGFREADPPKEKAALGARSFFGFDAAAPRLIHAHVHYLLMIGHDLSKGYRLPLEDEFLSSSRQSGAFRVPAPELEFVAYVIRMVLKRGTLDSILRGRGRLSERESNELAWLEERADPDRVRDVLESRPVAVDAGTFSLCREALRPGASTWRLWQCGRRIRADMASRSPRSPLADARLRLGQTLSYRGRKMRRGKSPRHTPIAGGFIVAAVGSDGAGKSTALDTVEDWLSKDLDVLRVHLGKPPWSRTSVFVRGSLKLGRMAGGLSTVSELSKLLCVARDRQLEYRKAATAAARGRIVLCDRYPLPGLINLDGPLARELTDGEPAGSFGRFAVRTEERMYDTFARPDLLFVLQLPADISLTRKPEDNPERVSRWAHEVLETDWSSSGAVVLDATRSAPEIAAEMKRHIWRRI
jgi:thymidylate kinase